MAYIYGVFTCIILFNSNDNPLKEVLFTLSVMGKNSEVRSNKLSKAGASKPIL